ncbi:MAG: polysaccharide biosynthesis protein [Syntrophobacteraceae bacterium CG2_30_61_12]|nr:MAG: polysaccharide biosynthesis protein [Syntrophobacteraceae bacterium CG2_30_61_12]
MFTALRNPRFYVMLALDALNIAGAVVLAYLIRFEFNIASYLPQIFQFLCWFLPLQLAFLFLFGLYRGMWRFAGINDLYRLLQAVVAGLLVATAIILYLYRFQGYSRGVLLLVPMLVFLFCGGARLSIRFFYARHNIAADGNFLAWLMGKQRRPGSKCVLLIGAGGSGEKMLREIQDNPTLEYRVGGFLDDDNSKRGRTIHGVPVLGTLDDLAEVTARFRIDEIFICAPSASGAQMRRIVEACKGAGRPFKTLPAIGSIMTGKVSVKSLRDVDYQDLLRRPPVRLDSRGIRSYLTGRRILVTGAGGSIGSELCRQLIRFDPEQLILVDAGEANLYHIQMEMRHEFKFQRECCILARIQDRSLMAQVFAVHRPQVVFHAAAYKHVPMLERNPWEAVFNNVVGSRVTMDLAARFGTERFVLVSTDKAVRPTNVMGTSKRITELILQSFNGSGTRFMAVRFGNVIGSSGSVIPLFRKQIEQGGPVTVTDPEVTRYFMTIPEAAQLILQAGALGSGGEIFVLEMGTPVKIADLAQDLIRLCGKRPNVDVDIIFTGLREGEKMYEELITIGEDVDRTSHEKIMVLKTHPDLFDGDLAQFRRHLDHQLAALFKTAASHDAEAIRCRLHEIVPEYTPQDSVCVFPQAQNTVRKAVS